jgi:hypothetical protein
MITDDQIRDRWEAVFWDAKGCGLSEDEAQAKADRVAAELVRAAALVPRSKRTPQGVA